MAEWIFTGSRFAYRDDKNVLHVVKRGAKIDLSEEQEQRLRAGEAGSQFMRESDFDDSEPETVEVAVANEATKPAEDGSPIPSPAGVATKRVRTTPARGARVPVETREDREEESVPEPTTSTEKKGK